MGAASLAAIFTTPPTMIKGDPDTLMEFLTHFDFDRDAPKIYAKGSFTVDGKTVDYKESAWEFMTPPDADDPRLEKLKAAGHKLILYHGQSDGVFSFNASANWIDKLDAEQRRRRRRCRASVRRARHEPLRVGPATDSFDMLSAIVDWAEKGKAPDRILARQAGQQGSSAGLEPARTRPLCPWPKVARYVSGRQGKGGELRVQVRTADPSAKNP